MMGQKIKLNFISPLKYLFFWQYKEEKPFLSKSHRDLFINMKNADGLVVWQLFLSPMNPAGSDTAVGWPRRSICHTAGVMNI